MALEPQAPRLRLELGLVGARAGDEEAHAVQARDDPRQRVERDLEALLVDEAADEQHELLGRVGEARPQRREVVDRREVERVDAVGDDLDLGLVDAEDVGDVALHVVAADDDALRAAHHPALDAVDVALRVLVDPALVAAVLGGVDRRQVRAPRRARQRRGGAARRASRGRGRRRSRSGRSARARPRACARSCPRPRPRTRRGRAASRARACGARARRRGPPRAGRLAPAREDVDRRRPAPTSPSESLRTWRARPPSTIGGYSQERIRMRRGTSGAGAYRRARERGCRPDDASVPLLGPETGQDRAS